MLSISAVVVFLQKNSFAIAVTPRVKRKPFEIAMGCIVPPRGIQYMYDS